MNKPVFTTLIFCFSLCCQLTGQSYWSKRFDLDIGNDYATHVVPIANGVILQAIGGCNFNTIECRGLVKLDFEGNLVWKAVLYDTIEWNGLNAFIVRDDTILINMDFESGANQNKAFTIFSYDLNGNYTSRFDYNQEKPYSGRNMLLRPDGNVYVGFDIRHPISNKIIEYTRCYDRNWNLLWDIHTPETGTINSTNSAVSLDDGLIYGYTHWPGGGQDLAFHVEKYSKDGELEWHTQYPYSCDNHHQLIKINAMPDGSYIGAFKSDTFGLFSSYSEFWFKLDANGNRVWEKINIFEERLIYHSFVAQNGNIIACGEMPDYYFDTIQDPKLSGYLMCLNSDGERLWERKILDKTQGVFFQSVYGGAELPNRDLVFVGVRADTTSPLIDPRGDDMWVFKTDSLGCIVPGCGEWQTLVGAGEPPAPPDVRTFCIYPNPVKGRCYLAARLGEAVPPGQYQLRLYDPQGSFLFSRNIEPMFINQLDLAGAPPGLCTAVLFRDGELYQAIKVVLEAGY